MDLSIQHIDLELALPNGKKYANIENEIQRKFTELVLNPLDKSLGRVKLNNSFNYIVDDISIEEEGTKLSDLDSYFIRVRKQLERAIKHQIKNPRVRSRNTGMAVETKKQCLTLLLDYIHGGILILRLKPAQRNKVIKQIKAAELLKEVKERRLSLSASAVGRLLELFSFNSTVTYLVNELRNKKIAIQSFLKFWEPLLEFPTKEMIGDSLSEIIQHISKQVVKSKNVSGEEFEAICVLLLASEAKIAVDSKDLKVFRTILSERTKSTERKKNLSKNLLENVDRLEKEKEHTFSDSTEIQLELAGLFLLHPFLSQFFKNCKVIQGDEISNIPKALQLLYYLATGQNVIPKNFELPTAKILLGLSLSESYLESKKLSKAQINNCDELLEAVINHWGALGNTSPDGLRQLFISRPAVARMIDNNWSIQIEKQAQDILLEKLPWGVGVVKLPWMKGTVNVKFEII